MSVGNIQVSVITAAAVTAAAVPASQPAAAPVAPVKTASPVKTPAAPKPVSDASSLSDTALLLNGLEIQLTTSRPSDFKSLLEGAARSIYTAAQQQESNEQSKTLESIADRLQFAANIAGLSSQSPLSLSAFLE